MFEASKYKMTKTIKNKPRQFSKCKPSPESPVKNLRAGRGERQGFLVMAYQESEEKDSSARTGTLPVVSSVVTCD